MFALGLAALAASSVSLALLFEPALSWYFQLAWWSYIVAADGLNRRLSGQSLIRDRPLTFLWLCGLSVAWWTLFEAINLRLGNWYYVMDHPQRAVRWAGGVVAFATVLPGIVETLELLENRGWPRRLAVRLLRWTTGKDAACVSLGLAFLALPLLWPDAFFPLTWGSFALLLEPWNRRHARRSFLRDLEAGEAAPIVRTLLAGLLCGLLWELWNNWARTKWIYTVPGFEEWKLFEMPLLGFLGFPPFALESLVVVRFVQEMAERVARWGRTVARAVLAGVVAASSASTLAIFAAADAVTVDSFYVPVAGLRVPPPPLPERLAAAGLSSPEKLLRALDDPGQREEWARRSGVGAVELQAARERVALVMHRGLGQERALRLERLGVVSRGDLARWTPAELAAALRVPTDPRDRFLERRARVWLQGLSVR